jgi:filamentous hemagglutinin family protein
LAQNITLDGTLGPAATLTGPTYQIRQDLGQTVGSNLFHSFGKFNLNANETAVFQSAPAIRNILSRVTGGSVSSIDGLIFTQSGAVNLYLINPAGIVFGPNARLDIGSSTRGSFVATTLDAITFPNDSQFSATNPGTASTLLTIVGDPSGFLASQRTLPPIAATGSILGVYSGQSLLLLGGNITLDNSNVFVNFPQGGRVELGALAGAGVVGLSVNGNDLQLSLPEQTARADVTINRSAIDVQAEDAGSLGIGARNLDINNSLLLAGIGSGLGTINSQAGDITLNATDTIQIRGASFVNNNVRNRSIGNAGNLIISADNLIVIENSELQLLTRGQGNAGNILINVRDRLLFDQSVASSSVQSGAIGNGGNIRVSTGTLTFTNTARLSVSTRGVGNAGTIDVEVRDRASFDDSYLSGIVAQEGVGNGGNLSLVAETLYLTNGGQLTATTNGRGNAGNVRVNVRDQIIVDGYNPSAEFPSGIFSEVASTGIGKGGDIQVSTGSLFINRGAQFFAGTRGIGDAGTIQVTARDIISLNGFDANTDNVSGLITSADSPTGRSGNIFMAAPTIQITNGAQVNAVTASARKGGDITIRANELIVLDGGQVTTTTFFQGQAGNITLEVRDRILLSGKNPDANNPFRQGLREGNGESGLFASTRSGSTGIGGSIFINSKVLIVQDGARISVASQGSGRGGDIDFQTDQLTLNNRGQISAETTSSQGGSIILNVRDLLLLRRGSQISTSAGTAQAGGDGGNISIQTPFIVGVLSENSDITANAFTGRGGNINITTNAIYGLQFQPQLTPFSDITASSQFGISGTVAINTLNIDPSRGLVELPANLTDPSQQIAQGCTPGSKVTASSFVATGRGGIPLSPDEPLESRAVVTKWVPLPEEGGAATDEKIDEPDSQVASALSRKSATPIVEAQSWIVRPDGVVELVATAPNGDRSRFGAVSVSCRTSQGK